MQDKPYDFWSISEVAHHLENYPNLRYVAEEGDEVVGFALDEERHHICAISGFFLAESRRYRDPHDPQADGYYLEALDILEEILGKYKDHHDAWNLPWTRWHLADLYLERGETERVLRLAEESEREAVDAAEDACE